MFKIEGKYTSAKIFAETIEDGVIEQTTEICNHPIFKDCKIRVMPDCHRGKGCTIGFTAELPKNREIIPNIIGVDQNCGMYVVKLKKAKTIRDDYSGVVIVNKEVANLLNRILMVYASKVSFDALRDYGDFEIYPEDLLELD